MELSGNAIIAIFLGYTIGVGTWVFFTQTFPVLWTERSELRFARPKVELVWGVLALFAVLGLNVVYTGGGLLPLPSGGLRRDLIFLLNVVLIWSPMLLVLLLRQQGLDTCLFSLRGLGKKILWGLAGAGLAVLTYLLSYGDADALPRAIAGLASWHPLILFQGLVQYLGLGFLLVRVIGVAGRLQGSLVCGLIYGLVKYPYYMNQLGMDWQQATSAIAVSCFVAVAAIYLVYRQQDMIAPAIIHTFMDLIQTSTTI